MINYHTIVRAFNGSIWAIMPEKLEAIAAFLAIKAQGGKIELGDTFAAAKKSKTQKSSTSQAGSIAVLPVSGTICHRMNLMNDISGGTSTELLSQQFEDLVDDSNVAAIVLDIDSPGGEYSGTMEFAAKVAAARGKKPIIGIANSMAASAAYWIGTACDSLSMIPSGLVGSVGAVMVHYDESEANAEAGIKATYITYGANKAEANPDMPLSDTARANLQALVDECGENFVKAVAANRKTTQTKVRETFGQGRVFGPSEAMKRGMVDCVETMDELLARLATPKSGKPAVKTDAVKSAPSASATSERERLKLDKISFS